MITSIFYSNPDYYPPIINSAHVLANEGYRQHLICRIHRKYWSINYPKTMEISRIADNGNSLRSYLNFIRISVKLANSQSDLFLGHDMHGFLVARILGWLYGKPVIYHCHDFVEDDRKIGLGGTLVKRFERLFARSADLVIVPDQDRARVIKQQLSLEKMPIIVANSPLSLINDCQNNILEQTLSEHGFSFERVLLRQGRIGPGHTLEETIRSIPLWKSRKWGFVILGEGDEDYINSLKDLASEHNVKDQVAILPPVSYTDILQYTADADVGHALYEPVHINNKHITTASNKIMEYMAAGIPVLLSKTTGSENFINKYKNGIMADVKSVTSIANSINQLFEDPKLIKRLGNAGKQAFEREFQYSKQYASVVSFIKDIANTHEF